MFRETKELYEFGPFRLDVEEHTLTRTDGSMNDLLPEKAFQTLCLLVQKRGHLLTKQELLAEIWPDSFVEENNLDKCIHAIRQTLGEKPGENKYIETVRKHGYRFVAPVNSVGTSHEGAASVLDSEFLTEWTPNFTVADGERAAAPDRLSWTPRSAIIVVGIFLVVIAIGSAYFLYPAKEVVAKDRTEFAVLPVNPIDPANRSDLYEIGIADSLIQGLSSVKGFVVRPLTATRKYTDIGQDPLAAGREQKVDYVLVSSYQIADGRIKLTSHLFNVADGKIEETYQSENELTGVFAAQEAVAGSIRSKLMARFASTAVRSPATRGTTNDEAYNYYLQGTVLTDNRRAGPAIENLEKAVELDPGFARAWAAMAHAHFAGIGTEGITARDAHHQRLIEAANIALSLDPNISEAYSALCVDKYFYQYDFAGAERACQHALKLDANSAIAHAFYSGFLSTRGRHDEAIAEIRMAIDLDPKSNFHKATYAKALYWARRYDEAVTQAKQILEVDPNNHASVTNLFCISLMQGKDSEAFEWLIRYLTIVEKDEKTISKTIQRYRAAYTASGWRGVSLEGVPFYIFRRAGLYIRAGNKDAAFECLEKAYEDRTWLMAFLQIDPQLDPLRGDPRYLDLVRRVESNGNGSS